MAQLQSTSITGSLIVTGGITGSFSGSIVAPGSTTQVLYNNGGVISANSGFVYNSGNIGINTTSPTSKLTVNGNTHIIGSGTPGSGAGMELQYSSNTSYIGSYDRDSSVYRNLFFYSADTIFENGGTERMRITSAGNVGIGTASPSSKLFISAPALGTSTGDYVLNSIHSNSNSNAEELEIKSVREASGNDWTYGGKRIQLRIDSTYMGYMQFNGYGNNYGISFGTGGTTSAPGNVTERMRITNGGNVGIGTTSPLAILSVGNGSLADTNVPIQISSEGTGTQKWIGINKNGNYGLLIGYIENGGLAGNGAYVRQITSDPLFLMVNNTTAAMTVLSSGNIGINTSSPNTTLEVNKNVSFSSVDTYAQLVVKTTSGANGKLLNIGVDESAGLSFIQSLNRGTDSMPLILQRYSGNVGISTTSPAAKLHVIGEIRSSTTTSTYGFTTMQPGGDTVQGYFEWFKPGPTRVAYMGYNDGSSANNLGLQLENSANFIINGGNVSIGTTSSTQKLQVNGNIALGSTSTGYQEAGSKYIGTSYSSPATDGWNGIQIESVNAPAPYDGNYSQNLKFYTHHYGAGTGATPRVTIQYNGNVGIGNTSPTSKLYVEGGSTNWDQTNQGTAVGTIHLDPGVTTDNFGNAITFGASDSSAGATAQAGIYVRTDGSYGSKMYFSTTDQYANGSSTRMMINESGNVGIGTTSPSAKLDVNGGDGTPAGEQFAAVIKGHSGGSRTLYFDGTSNASVWWGSGNSPQFAIDSISGGGAAFWTNDGSWSERMRIDSSGNFMIGTTTPLLTTSGRGTLTLNGSSTSILTLSNGGTWKSYFYNDGTNTYVGAQGGFGVAVNGAGTVAMYINSSANVGIGTSSPGSKLDVAGALGGTVGVGGSTLRLINTDTGNYSSITAGVTGVTNTGMQFSTDGTTRMIIASNGNVSIGTTAAPGNRLIVSQDSTYNNENTYAVAAAASTSTDYKTLMGYDYSNDVGVISAVRAGVAWKNISISPVGGANVGIGTLTPTTKLDIVGGTLSGATESSYALRIRNGSGNKPLTFGSDSSYTYIQSWGSAPLRLNNEGNDTLINPNSGNVGIGTLSPGAKLEVNGSFRATTKSFIIDHPTKENKKLQYGVLEGPEHSVYVRGKLTNTNVIQLPDYWHALVHEGSITVNLTAIGKKQDLWVEEITDTYITVASETGDINCFYAVFAERKDIEKLVTEFDKE